jgi:hypothetical protein
MTGRRAGWTVAASACALACAAPARAGVTLVSEFAATGQTPRQAKSFVGTDRVRVETASNDVIIFRGDRDLMWILRPKDHTYVEMNRDSMKALRQQMDAAMAKMKAEIEKLPPEQRARIEKTMKERGLDTPGIERAEEPVKVEPTGRSDVVGGLACRELEVYRGAAKQYEVCVADWQTAGVTKDDLAALRKVGSWQDEIRSGTPLAVGGAARGDDAMKLMDRLDGVPVRVRGFREGKAASEMRVTKIEKTGLDATLFDVPPGYRMKTIGGTR